MAEITTQYPEYVPVADDLQGRAAWPAYRRLSRQERGVFGLGVAAAAGAAAIVATGEVVTYSDAFAAVLVANIVGLTIAGLLWLHARPWNRLGAVLLQFGLVAFLCSFAGASSPVLFLVGNIALWLFGLGVVWLMAAFPSGRLDTGGRVLVAFAAVVFIGIGLPQLFLTQQDFGVAFVGRCFAGCPRNLLLVSASPDIVHGLKVAQGIGRAVLSVAIVVLFAFRYARASRPRRRIVLPMYVVSLLYAGAVAVDGIAVDALGHSAELGMVSRSAIVGARILFPFGFVAAILLAHAYAGTALAGMARELGETTSATQIESLVRRVLDDTSARLGFWVARFGTFTDLQGHALELEPAEEWRTWRCFDRRLERVLALEHDAALADDPELVQAVGAAALIGLENRRLQHNLLDSIEELRASRRRLVVAAAGERRRIERNLHDGTQQRLVALRIQLELAREQAPSGSPLRARLAQMGNELSESLDELRAVAHGIYPQLLIDEGLPAALHDTAPRIGIPVDVETEDVGRFAEEAEVAVYYTCLEALQNAVKHGGADVSGRVTVRREGRTLYFRVADDGVGFAIRHRRDGSGLTNMTDRIGAVGGSIAIRSAPGRGTTIEGRIPLDPDPSSAGEEVKT